MVVAPRAQAHEREAQPDALAGDPEPLSAACAGNVILKGIEMQTNATGTAAARKPLTPDGAAGRLAWADDAERRALAQEVYTRVMGFVLPRIAAREIPFLTVAIDEALDGVAQTRRIARIDDDLRSEAESQPAAAITGSVPRLVDIRASGLPGDCGIVLDFIRMVFVTHGWSVKRIDDGVRPYIEVLLMPEMEACLREWGLPQVDAA